MTRRIKRTKVKWDNLLNHFVLVYPPSSLDMTLQMFNIIASFPFSNSGHNLICLELRGQFKIVAWQVWLVTIKHDSGFEVLFR